MGGHGTARKSAKLVRAEKAKNATLYHPNFSLPEMLCLPKNSVDMQKEIVEYVIESAARLVSPSPKVDNENEEIRCDDMARMIRKDLKKAIFNKLNLDLLERD